MAGRILDEDIVTVRERASIVEVIGEHVTLRPAGGGNLKGLCPFHDEKSPSFNVTPVRNVYYCFGCGKGGDSISFLMEVDHLSFTEAVERLAAVVGITLRYDQSGPQGPRQESGGKKRLLQAHADAAAFYAERLLAPDARAAREFLAVRGFDRDAAARYGCGFAPDGWDVLSRHLGGKGYKADELIAAGLSKQARSGRLIDRFRRRQLWPIRDLSGDVIGFGARKRFDDDDGPQYLNTPETAIYKKSHVLYGIDQAKREIARQGRAVIVEGYTDVMACHLAGVPTAIATCGTAFGSDHISVLRRLLVDTNTNEFSGEVIFTFDGDEAGQRAALRAFEDDQRFMAQTFVAISPGGMDPCELRLDKGDAAVRDLVASREPLADFAIRSTLARYDLDTVEGQVRALEVTAPMVAKLKVRAIREQYANRLARYLGLDDVETVRRAVGQADRRLHGQAVPPPVAAKSNDRQLFLEREALKLAMQFPALAGPLFDTVDAAAYSDPMHAAVRSAIAAAGGVGGTAGGPSWVESVRQACTDLGAQALVSALAVEPPKYDGEPDPRYVTVTLAGLQLPLVARRLAELKSKMQRMNPVTEADEYRRLFGDLASLEQQRRGLHEQVIGGL